MTTALSILAQTESGLDDEVILTVIKLPTSPYIVGATSFSQIARCNMPVTVDVTPGNYEIEASAEGYCSERISVLVGSEPATSSIRLSKGTQIRGIVTLDSFGVEGAQVCLTSKTVKLETVTSIDGRYSFGGIPPGDCSLTVTARGCVVWKSNHLHVHSHSEQVDLNVILTRGTIAKGRIIDEQGAPIPNADIYPANAEQLGVKSNSLGEFSIDVLPREVITMNVRAPGHSDKIVKMSQPQSGTLADVTLEKAGEATVRVVAPHLPSELAITIEPAMPGRQGLRREVTTSRAVMTSHYFDRLGLGRYFVRVEAPGLEQESPVEILLNESELSVHVTVNLKPCSSPIG